MQLLISECADLARFTFPNDCGFVLAPGLNVTIEAVVRKVELATDKPLCPWIIPFENLVPFLEPMQLFRNARPKLLRVLD
jgi:hypothetical protein